MESSICSTLTGFRAVKHPKLGFLVREDGAVLLPIKGWSYGKKTVKGYMRIHVGDKFLFVHRIVAEAFIPNTENKPTVDHINRNKTDNRVCNLRYATMREQLHNTEKWLKNENQGIHVRGHGSREYNRLKSRRRRAKLAFNRWFHW